MENKIILTKEFLDELLENVSTKTVGELLSIVETVLENDEEKSKLIKRLLKNSVYQKFREISCRIEAYQKGIDFIKITHKPTSK